MPEEDAKYHLKRCVDSGLWLPDASKVEKGDAAEGETEGEPSTAAGSAEKTEQ